MTDPLLSPTHFHHRLKASARKLFWLGVAFVLLGIAAIVFPIASTMVATMLVGWVLLITGGFLLAGCFSIHGTGPFFAALLLSLLSLASGVFLLFNPLAGATALTMMLGVLFMFQGAFETLFAFEVRPHAGWVGILVSGIASIILALLIAAGWPAVSAVALGILMGVNLISSGVGYLILSRALDA